MALVPNFIKKVINLNFDEDHWACLFAMTISFIQIHLFICLFRDLMKQM